MRIHQIQSFIELRQYRTIHPLTDLKLGDLKKLKRQVELLGKTYNVSEDYSDINNEINLRNAGISNRISWLALGIAIAALFK